MNRVFQRTGQVSPRRSMFDLSYSKLLTGELGKLYPVLCDEVVPGDFWQIGNETVLRFNPLLAPVLHRIDCVTHYFFVPYRILDENWEDFITGGKNGDNAYTLPRFDDANPKLYGKGYLWDYFGFPLGDGVNGSEQFGMLPLAFPWYAYNKIWNEYYRDENLQDEVVLWSGDVLHRSWEKDYFTSALPFQQRGTSPAFPVSGSGNVEYMTGDIIKSGQGTNIRAWSDSMGGNYMTVDNTDDVQALENWFLNSNKVTIENLTTFDVNDLRLAFQIQKWMERNARAGVRYTEFLQAHFGVYPRDERLQRPEYIGGTKNPVIVSEVLQTSSTDGTSPQGNMAGHAINVQQGYVGKYHVKEYGIIMGLMSIMPKPAYMQGINRQWLRETRYDFYFPEFANLSEQAIMTAELYNVSGQSEVEARSVFGFQGRYDEMRVKQNLITGDFRDTFNYWHLGREFSNKPLLNESFILCNPTKRYLAVNSEPAFLCNFGNIIKAFRPLPVIAEPGFIDH